MALTLRALLFVALPALALGARVGLLAARHERIGLDGEPGSDSMPAAAARNASKPRHALRTDLMSHVRADAATALANLEVSGEVPKAVQDLCSACQRVLLLQKAECGPNGCQDPCDPDSWHKRVFGLNEFCPVVRTLVENHGDSLGEHVRLMRHIVRSKDAYLEVCRDLRLCGLSENVLLHAKAPDAVKLRESIAQLVSESPLGQQPDPSAGDFEELCQECQVHVGQPADDAECFRDYEGPALLCKPRRYCDQGQEGLSGKAPCHLRPVVGEQRAMSFDELTSVPRAQRVVSPLLLAAGGAPTTPMLHAWADTCGTEQACAVVGLCGNEPGALYRQLTFQRKIAHLLADATDFFETKYGKLFFFKDLRATWQATSVSAKVSRELFEMRHFVSDGVQKELQESTRAMLQAMVGSGFLKSSPRYLQPVLADSVRCLTSGRAYGPELFLRDIAKGFAVELTFGGDAGAAGKALRDFARAMQGREGVPLGVVEQDDGDLLDLSDALEVPFLDDWAEAAAAAGVASPVGLVELGSEVGAQQLGALPHLVALAQVKAAYSSVVSFCSSVAIYAGRKEHLPYCVAWPVVVAKELPTVIGAVRSIKDWRHHLTAFSTFTARLVGSEEFGEVLAEVVEPLVEKALEGDLQAGLAMGAEALVAGLPELASHGKWSERLHDHRVKAAVAAVFREAVADAGANVTNLKEVIPALTTRSISLVGMALFEVLFEETTLWRTAKLVDMMLEQAGNSDRSLEEKAVALFATPGSPLLDFLAESCPEMLELLMPGLDTSGLHWVEVLRKRQVREKLEAAIEELEPPLTARSVAGQLLGHPALREELLRQATEELAPGFEAAVHRIAGPASKEGVEFLVASALAFR